MFNTYRPSWTSVSRDGLDKQIGTFIRVEQDFLFDVVFGVHTDNYDVRFKERWHRLRTGFPLKAITIDFEQRKNQVQGRIETNWLLLNICISFVLWISLELIIRSTRRPDRQS
jgi:hypothetical protein